MTRRATPCRVVVEHGNAGAAAAAPIARDIMIDALARATRRAATEPPRRREVAQREATR